MKTPAFWRSRNLLASCLWPVGVVYQAITRWRMRLTTPQPAPLITLCIGNIVAGGAGKTPTALAIRHLLNDDAQIAFLSRGYGGKPHHTAIQVNPRQHSAADVGDEPLLLAEHAPTYVCTRRVAAASMAAADGATIAIMDDGLQNPSLQKHLSLLVIDGEYGLGNGLPFPAGPLRETLASAFARVQAMILIGDDIQQLRRAIPAHISCFTGRLTPRYDSSALGATPLLAFAGIGRPEKFFTSLRQLGLNLAETRSFADHHPYSEAELIKLQQRAAHHQARLITTEKDAVRLPPHLRSQVLTLPVELRFDEPDAVRSWIAQAIVSSSHKERSNA